MLIQEHIVFGELTITVFKIPIKDEQKLFSFRYLWIKHNNQNDIKEGPISNFMPNIDCKIDAAYWLPQRATAYLFNGTDSV